MTIPFTKMQGLGNDFVVIDTIRQAVDLSAPLIKKMADRHFGIGFDQLLMVEAAKRPEADFEYRIFNADGSEVSQCGNGARCVGRYLWENKLASAARINLGTKDRILEVHVQPDSQISVNMGIPLFEPEQIPFLVTEQAQSYPLTINNQVLDISVVNVGNPHAVLKVADINQVAVDQIGSKIESHPFFPLRVNVGFVEYVDRAQIRLRVFERGVGETLACGSGACAAVSVGRQLGQLEQEVLVELMGGKLKINWPGEGQAIWMTGTAEFVFRGEWL